MPSPWPRFTTLVSPVTRCTPASLRHFGHAWRKCGLQVIHGKALFQNKWRSREVARAWRRWWQRRSQCRIRPTGRCRRPGKKCGVTTKLSVENARRSPGAGAGRTAASSPRRSSSAPIGREEHLVDDALHHGSARAMTQKNGFVSHYENFPSSGDECGPIQ